MKSKIVLPYAPILVESTRSIGYSFESALADIIDNSLGKSADEINVLFSSKEPQFVAGRRVSLRRTPSGAGCAVAVVLRWVMISLYS